MVNYIGTIYFSDPKSIDDVKEIEFAIEILIKYGAERLEWPEHWIAKNILDKYRERLAELTA